MPQNKVTIRGRFKPSPAAEREFYRQLKKVAQASSHVVERHVTVKSPYDPKALKEMQEELEAYSRKLGPWAENQARKMLQTVSISNKRAYQIKSKAIGIQLKEGRAQEETMMTAAGLMFEQVELIKSIPLESGLNWQQHAFELATSGQRAKAEPDLVREIKKRLGFTTEQAVNRAMLIARTETARANAMINQSRAQAVGSRQYRWHNSGDAAVRPSHMKLKGKSLQGMIFLWDNPPTLDDGMTGHPGTFPNCRCYAEPVFDDE